MIAGSSLLMRKTALTGQALATLQCLQLRHLGASIIAFIETFNCERYSYRLSRKIPKTKFFLLFKCLVHCLIPFSHLTLSGVLENSYGIYCIRKSSHSTQGKIFPLFGTAPKAQVKTLYFEGLVGWAL